MLKRWLVSVARGGARLAREPGPRLEDATQRCGDAEAAQEGAPRILIIIAGPGNAAVPVAQGKVIAFPRVEKSPQRKGAGRTSTD